MVSVVIVVNFRCDKASLLNVPGNSELHLRWKAYKEIVPWGNSKGVFNQGEHHFSLLKFSQKRKSGKILLPEVMYNLQSKEFGHSGLVLKD